jgi:hypothetical protein
MLEKIMAIPHHTYLIMMMSAPNGILSVLGNIMVSYNCESSTVELTKDSACKAAATVMVAQAAKVDQTTMEMLEQKRTNMAKPSCKKYAKKLKGMMAALGRFISKLGEKGFPSSSY